VLILVDAAVPKPAVLSVLGELSARLARPAPPGQPVLRLRAAVHAGEVHADPHGVAGADVNHAFRLADCGPLRSALRDSQGNLAVIVSDGLYHAIVRHGYPGLPTADFHPVPVRVKETEVPGWLAVPGDGECARRIAAGLVAGPRSPAGPAQDGGAQINGSNVEIRQSAIGGRDAYSNPARERPARALWRPRRG
jgi:hypothetical protein